MWCKEQEAFGDDCKKMRRQGLRSCVFVLLLVDGVEEFGMWELVLEEGTRGSVVCVLSKKGRSVSLLVLVRFVSAVWSDRAVREPASTWTTIFEQGPARS